MCSAASPTCCSPPRAIRRCCSISTTRTSIGPNSVAGINRSRGLNENLAREILELHTLGVRTGYTQDDVTSFAKVITGWTMHPDRQQSRARRRVLFHPRMHEPGAQTVIGKTYPDTGVEQGRAVLADLARHPATAKHVAPKLARHFVADEPPPALVERLAKTLPRHRRRSQGGRQALVTRRKPGRASAPRSSARANGSIGASARDRAAAADVRAHRARARACSASRCGGRRRRRASPTTTPPGSTASAQRLDIAKQFAQRVGGAASTRRRCSRRRSARWRRPRRGRPSRAPRAGRRRWRCC